MDDFRHLFNQQGQHQLVDNNRPIQPLNDRTVFYRAESYDEVNAINAAENYATSSGS